MPVRILLAIAIALLVLPTYAAKAKHHAPPKAPLSASPAAHGLYDDAHFCRVSDLHRGQVGYALTVFQGTKIERFNIAVLGVLKKVNNGHDLVLIKMTNGQAVTRGAMIAHGMSGSPVYVGGKLVGAIAYGFSFPREPLAMVTPIGDMVESLSPTLTSEPQMALGPTSLPTVAQAAVSNSLLANLLSPSEVRELPQDAEGTTQLVPLSMPIMVSGMSQRAITHLSKSLAPFGLTPMAGSGSGSAAFRPATDKDRAQLVPGASVGCSLVRGDIDFSGIGTLTYRNGNRVVAFGHPMMGLGPIDAPMTTATIADLYPSLASSTKLGSAEVTVGRISQDRPFSIGGTVGEKVNMVPVTIDVKDNTTGMTKTFHCRVINNRLLTPILIPSIIEDAVYQIHSAVGEAYATSSLDVDTVQGGDIQRSNVYFDSVFIEGAIARDAETLMSQLQQNPYEPVTIKSVNFKIEIDAKHPTAQIRQISAPKQTYEPGDTINLSVVLQPFNGAPELRTIPLTIPASTPNGMLIVSVKGGEQSMIDYFMEIFGIMPQPGAPPVNLRQVIRKYLEKPKNNQMVAKIQFPTFQLDVEGEKLPFAPPNLEAIIRSRHSTGLRPEKDEIKVTQDTPWIVSGSQMLRIAVARKNTLDTPQQGGMPQQPDMGGMQFPQFEDGAIMPQSAGASVADPMIALAPDAPAKPAPTTFTSHSVTTVTTVVTNGPGQPDTKTGKPASSAKGTPVARQPQLWRQDRAEQFAMGKFDGTAVNSLGSVQTGASPALLTSGPASYALSLAADDKGSVYIGTGDSGVIYKDAKPVATRFFGTGEVEVTALAFDAASGNLFAGTAPNGILFKIARDGKGEKIFTASEPYITALQIDAAHGFLYIGTGGGSGKVYRAPLGKPTDAKLLLASPSAHILALASDSKGTLYASAAPDGLVYRVDPSGNADAIYSAGDQNVTGLAVGAGDALYVGISPKGSLLKLTPDVAGGAPIVKQLLPKVQTPINAMQAASDGTIWAAGDNAIFKIGADDAVLMSATDDSPRFVSVAAGPSGTAFAGAADTADVYRAAPTQVATFTSAVHDAKVGSHWGSIAWDAANGDVETLKIRTRTGDISRPDSTWSPWSDAYTNSQGSQVTSPPARYIQYQAQLTDSAALRAVRIAYLGNIQSPTVKIQSPLGGDAISGDYSVKWTGSDPDKDTLAYDLFYSTNGTDWTPLKPEAKVVNTKHQVVPSGTPKPVQPSNKQRGSKTPLAQSNNHVLTSLPPGAIVVSSMPAVNGVPGANVGDTNTQENEPGQMPGMDGMSMPDGSGNPAPQSKQVWKTDKLQDGRYWLKIVATNLPSNPVGSLTDTDLAGPFVIDNAVPKLVVDPSRATDDKKRLTLTGTATGNIAPVVSVQFKLDDETTWYAAVQTGDRFSLTTAPLTVGDHKVTIQALSKAGKCDEATITMTIP